VATLDLIMIYGIRVRLRVCLVDQDPQYKAQRNLFPGKGLKSCRRLARMCGKPVVMGPVHCALAAGNPTMVSGGGATKCVENGGDNDVLFRHRPARGACDGLRLS